MPDAGERPLSEIERQHLTTRLDGARAESRRAMLETVAASAAPAPLERIETALRPAT